MANRFHGRAVERVTGRTLPPAFGAEVSAETVRRFRRELRSLPHVAHALSWLRGPKAVASSSPLDRIRAGLEVVGLIDVDAASCIVIEDSVPGVTAAVQAGMTAIGFVGSNPTPGQLANDLIAAGARTVIADMRALKSAVADVRGWRRRSISPASL